MGDWITCGFRQEWTWLFRRTNCTSFTPVMLEFELDRMLGSLDISFMLLGVGFWLSVAVGTPRKELLDAIAEVVEEAPPQVKP